MSPIGTGPYQVESVSPTEGIQLTAFPDYFGGPAATKTIHVRFIADTTARTLAFASGQVDMIEGVRTPGWIPTMRQRSAEHDLRRDRARQLQPAAPQPDAPAAERSARPPGDPLRHQQRSDRSGFRGPGGPDGRDHRAAVRRRREEGRAAAGAAVRLRSQEGEGAAGRSRPSERRDHPLLHQPAGGLRRDHADASRSSCARPASTSTSRSSTTPPCTPRTARTGTRSRCTRPATRRCRRSPSCSCCRPPPRSRRTARARRTTATTVSPCRASTP